jgi:hypothetical protein
MANGMFPGRLQMLPGHANSWPCGGAVLALMGRKKETKKKNNRQERGSEHEARVDEDEAQRRSGTPGLMDGLNGGNIASPLRV